MAAQDGLLVRVKPFAGALTVEGLRLLADAAERHGSKRIDLTGRGAFQVRGLSEDSAPHFAAAMVAAGLASPDPIAEARRNVQLDPRASQAMHGWARDLERWLERGEGLDGLPSKFGFALSPEAGLDADICIVGDDRPGLRAAGADLAARVDDPVQAALGLARAFLDLAPKLSPSPRRMKTLVEHIGAAPVFAAARLAAERAPAPRPAGRGAGWEQGGFRLGVTFGAADADLLRHAAGLSERFGNGRLGLTPGRALWLAGVSAADAPALQASASRSGFIVDPGDPRLRVEACVGAAGCARTSADTRADALALAHLAPEGGLHVSGCVKGCAHPGPAAATLVGEGGAHGYHLLRDAAPGTVPPGRPLALIQIADVLHP